MCVIAVFTICLWTSHQDVTLAQVRLAMAEEEKEKAEASTSALYDVSASGFLLLGMDIQNIQCIFISAIYYWVLTYLLFTKTIASRRGTWREKADPPPEDFIGGMAYGTS